MVNAARIRMIAKQAGWDRAFGSFKQVFRMVLLAQEPGNPKARIWKPGVATWRPGGPGLIFYDTHLFRGVYDRGDA
jgi:hypothetical protein